MSHQAQLSRLTRGAPGGRHETTRRHNGKDLILEVKLARCLKKTFNLGIGQSPASIGHIVAFGNTEAYYRALILGVKQRGRPGDAFSEDTGRGYVAYKGGDYHDTIYNKLNTVILEVSGGMTHRTPRPPSSHTCPPPPQPQRVASGGTAMARHARSAHGAHSAAMHACFFFLKINFHNVS